MRREHFFTGIRGPLIPLRFRLAILTRKCSQSRKKRILRRRYEDQGQVLRLSCCPSRSNRQARKSVLELQRAASKERAEGS